MRRRVVLGSALLVRPEAVADAEVAITNLKTIRRKAAREVECVVIRAALDRVGWNRRKAARLLQVSYTTLLNKIRDYELARLPSGDAELFLG